MKNSVRTFAKRRATQVLAPNAEFFAIRAGLDPSPDSYANLDASTAHLSASMLLSIHSQIQKTIGYSAAENYITMIKDLPSLSAELFLNMFYTLEVAGWRWEKQLLANHSQFSSKVAASYNQPDKRDETHYIRTQFLGQLSNGTECVKIDKYSW